VTDTITAENDLETVSWRVGGMDCASCVAKVEKAVQRLEGVSDVQVSLMAERLTISRRPGAVGIASVEKQVAALGYTTSLLPEAGSPVQGDACNTCCSPAPAAGAPETATGTDFKEMPVPNWWQTGKARLLAALALLVGAAWLLSGFLPKEAYWIYLVATVAAVIPFGRRAFALARARTPFSIETLMCAAALGAVAIGAAEEAAVVVLLFALGELLENVAAGRARAGIRALAGLIPRTARREDAAGSVSEIAADRLAVGEIVSGTSALDESPVTGESMPVPRGPGEQVLAGSVNADAGLLRVRTTRSATDNTVARIVRLVEEAAASRAPTQRFVERFAEWWTPAAMGSAVLVTLVPPVLLGGDWWTWTYRGLALLLIACPCALVISVPAAVASGLAAGARRGLLIKGGAALEAIGTAKTVAFDKTGTLTEGRPRVTDVIPIAAGHDERSLLRLAAAVEQGSSHPLGRAIIERAAMLGIDIPAASDAHAVPGRAARATVDRRSVVVGSLFHAAETGVGIGSRAEALELAGKTVVAVLADGEILGLIAMRDEPREDAARGIAALKAIGISAVMLTGDNERTGKAIAGTLGMEVRARLLPEDKLREIAGLMQAGPVVMVGDGINDAPALAAATVGIAMGGGTDVALETSDAALLRGHVAGIAELVGLSRSTVSNIRQNIGVAVGLKAIFLITTLAGLTGLWPAILADTGATVLVTLNALRLLRWEPSPS
jgi:Cd2+/Zn2+-exporting ATPase